MRLVAQINAGNTSDLLEGCIAHHRALGVDAFVILHVHSDDNTPDLLRELEKKHTDITVIYGKPENIFNQVGQRQAVDVARSVAKADWIIKVDCDERWFAKEGSLKAAFEKRSEKVSIVVPRYNVVWPAPGAVGQAESTPLLLEQLDLVLFPVAPPTPVPGQDTLNGIPWVLTQIAPKSAMRGLAGLYSGQGGHMVEGDPDSDGSVTESESRFEILVAHLAFTSLTRFKSKLQGLSAWCGSSMPRPKDPWFAWHWYRLWEISRQGEEAIRAEWLRQFITPFMARVLVGRDVVVPGGQAFERMPRGRAPLVSTTSGPLPGSRKEPPLNVPSPRHSTVIDGRRICFLINGEPTDGYLSQIAFFNFALRQAPPPYCDARVIASLGTEGAPLVPERWRSHLHDVEVRFVPSEEVRQEGPFAQGNARVTFREPDIDYVIMCDTDTMVLDHLDEVMALLYNGVPVAGVIAHLPPPHFNDWNHDDTWRDVSTKLTGAPIPLRYFYTLAEPSQPSSPKRLRAPFYVNYGFAPFRADALQEFSAPYLKIRPKVDLWYGQKLFSGQIALALTVHALGWQPVALSMKFNYPNDDRALQLHAYEAQDIRVLHYLREHRYLRKKIFSQETDFLEFMQQQPKDADHLLHAAITRLTGGSYPF